MQPLGISVDMLDTQRVDCQNKNPVWHLDHLHGMSEEVRTAGIA
jgi:hypothetical protein